MSAEYYIRGLGDTELRAELNRRNMVREEEYRREQVEKYRLEREAEEERDRDFAEGVGVTWEQFQQIKDYVAEIIYAKQ